MGKYLVRCFPSHKSFDAALQFALKDMGLSRQGMPQGINISGEQCKAKKVWLSNLTMSKYFPPLPEHMKQQRKDADLNRYAKYLSRGVVSDPYRDIPMPATGGRKVGD